MGARGVPAFHLGDLCKERGRCGRRTGRGRGEWHRPCGRAGCRPTTRLVLTDPLRSAAALGLLALAARTPGAEALALAAAGLAVAALAVFGAARRPA